MRRLERFPVRSRFMNLPNGSSPHSAQQFAQDNPPDTAKDHPRPNLPHKSIDELVQLRIGHALNSSIFAA